MLVRLVVLVLLVLLVLLLLLVVLILTLLMLLAHGELRRLMLPRELVLRLPLPLGRGCGYGPMV